MANRPIRVALAVTVDGTRDILGTMPDEVMAALPLIAQDWHGTWNYILRPQPSTPTPLPRRDDRAPDWLHCTIPPSPAWSTRRSPSCRPSSSGASSTTRPSASITSAPATAPCGAHPLSLSDRLLVTVIRHRWKPQIRVPTSPLGSLADVVGDTLHEITPSWRPSTATPAQHRPPHPPRKTSPVRNP